MARHADARRRAADTFKVGQVAWLATKNLPLRSGTRKLLTIWADPFKVIGKVGGSAYRFELPDGWNIHNIFHVLYGVEVL